MTFPFYFLGSVNRGREFMVCMNPRCRKRFPYRSDSSYCNIGCQDIAISCQRREPDFRIVKWVSSKSELSKEVYEKNGEKQNE